MQALRQDGFTPEQEGVAHQLLRRDRQDSSHYKAEAMSDKKLTYEQYCEAVRCHHIRLNTPTSSELARKWGLGEQTVINAINRRIKIYEQRMQKELSNV